MLLELLNQCRNVIRGYGSIKLELTEEAEGLSVVLDRLALLLSLRFRSLCLLCGSEIVFLLLTLLGQNNLAILDVVRDILLLVDGLRLFLLRQEGLAEQEALLDQ